MVRKEKLKPGHRNKMMVMIAPTEKRDKWGRRLYLWKCDCGSEVVRANGALTGKSGAKSCGCLRRKWKIGDKHFSLTLAELSVKKTNSGRPLHRWICSCGSEVFMLSPTDGSARSCGCLRPAVKRESKWKIGDKRNRLTLVKKNVGRDKRNSPMHLWRCDCGNEIIRTTSAITCKRPAKSCGCLKREVTRSRMFKGVGNLSKTYFTHICCNADLRGIEVSVTMEYMWQIFDGKCAITGVPISLDREHGTNSINRKRSQTASLDRIDSSIGYVEGNIQWVHKRINVMKNSDSVEEFVDWCKLVVEHNS